MRFFGTATPYGGIRLYAMQPMGYLNATENADMVIQNVLNPAIRKGKCVRIADNLFTGGQTPQEAAQNFHLMLNLCSNSGLTFKASKTVICPQQVTILGKVWERGTLRPSNHLLSTLSRASYPTTVKQMRSFTGSVKQMKDNLPNYHLLLHPLEKASAGLKSIDRITWSDSLRGAFDLVKKTASNPEALTLPKPGEKLAIFPDWSDIHQAGGAPLYVKRDGKLLKVRNFGQRLNSVKRWAPCEGESWIARMAVEAHAPWIWEALPARTELNCDNMPSVLAAKRLQRGEFSRSVRVTYFLSTLAAYPVDVVYRKGDGHPGDYDSRHTVACDLEKCQVCQFAFELAGPTAMESMFSDETMTQVNKVDVEDVLAGNVPVPFSQASGWKNIQHENPTLRKLRLHMEGGTIPKRRVRGQTELKRLYDLFTKSKISISREDILVHQEHDNLGNVTETILVPSQIMKGLVLALHNKFTCPTRLELGRLMRRYWFSLGLTKVIEEVWQSCPRCQAAKNVPKEIFEQSTVKTENFGKNWAADVIRGDSQFIFCAREKLSSFTVAQLIISEGQGPLREAIISTTAELIPQDGLIMQVDNCPAFQALRGDAELARFGITLDLGREKNKNSNPVAEKGVKEFREEKKRIKPHGGSISAAELTIIIASLNRRIRNRNLSAREIITRRDQITNKSLNLEDSALAEDQFNIRMKNHPASAKSKARTETLAQEELVWPGALVVIKKDLNKLRVRETYLVVKLDEIEPQFCWIKKFENQCRGKDYKVKLTEVELVPGQTKNLDTSGSVINDDQVSNDGNEELTDVSAEDLGEKEIVTRPIKERTSTTKYSLRRKKRPDYRLMDQGVKISRLYQNEIPPRYGWVTQSEESTSEEEFEENKNIEDNSLTDVEFSEKFNKWSFDKTKDNNNESMDRTTFDERVDSTDDIDESEVEIDGAKALELETINSQPNSIEWDYSYCDGVGLEDWQEDNYRTVMNILEDKTGDEDSDEINPIPMDEKRRSTRNRKPYPYRGIDDFVDFDVDTDDEIFDDAYGPTVTRRQSRTLTTDSNLEEVLRKGEDIKMRRNDRNKVFNPGDVRLPSSSVYDVSNILQPHRPFAPELVQLDRWQHLDQVLQVVPAVVLQPRLQVDDVGVERAGERGRQGEGNGPAAEGGVRQMNN